MTKSRITLRKMTEDERFQELMRIRERALHDEASALANAERKEREKWQGIVTKKDAVIAEQAAEAAKQAAIIEELRALLAAR